MLNADDAYFAELRAREFHRLDHAYLDYTGSALYGESQIRAHHELLASGLFGNPHSDSGPSKASAEVMRTARDAVLEFFDVDASTHDVCFTANTTAAIKLVAEGYPFAPGVSCVLSVDNHNSVNGIREYARRAGASISYLPLDRELRLASKLPDVRSGLLAFPAQSNFSGVRHPLQLVEEAHDRGLDVLLDIAAFAPSHALSLRECKADFAALSFYKLFGYPTGVGALIARREALPRLRRPWFSGGTVVYASVLADTHRLRARHEAFEDGTPDFLGIAALPAGFALLQEVGMDRLSRHVAGLASILLEGLRALPHVRIYGPTDMKDRGGTVVFNVRDVPFSVVEERAAAAGVSLRGGCFCNPGASEVAFGLDAGRTASCLDAIGESFTVERFASCVDSEVGAVRISIGLANNADDIHRAIEVIRSLAS
ncbi:MAG: aminotransferase class V-fold PLP-dependent enzyme [Thermoanaerobaculia bacterium]